MEPVLTKEQRAHDLALILCEQELAAKRVACSDLEVFDFIKTYEHYYEYALKSLETVH